MLGHARFRSARPCINPHDSPGMGACKVLKFSAGVTRDVACCGNASLADARAYPRRGEALECFANQEPAQRQGLGSLNLAESLLKLV